ncbi:MAG: AmmeMemoRadiSam system protein B [Myxococcota bacterium]
MKIRHPAVAGLFYPDGRAELERSVADYLAAASVDPPETPAPKALIVPHAGFVYSGPVAASAYARIARLRGVVTRVVLLGPSHRAPLRGLAASSADAFATPLGDVRLDRDAIEQILAFPQVRLFDAAHDAEHSLEVQLPFLQYILGDFLLVPLSVGDAEPEQVSEVIEALWGGAETQIVVSSDLSHYYPYETARARDAATSRAIEALDGGGLDYESACGRVPTRGLLLAARRHGLSARTVDLRNSGDTAGGKSEVVGYGSYVFS